MNIKRKLKIQNSIVGMSCDTIHFFNNSHQTISYNYRIKDR